MAVENESIQHDNEGEALPPQNDPIQQRLAGYANEFRERMNERGFSVSLDLENPFENVYVLLEELSIQIMSTYISCRYLEDEIYNPNLEEIYNPNLEEYSK